ncbi:primosomal protein N', partial [Candidatus Poribacteria bacterium]|nr:primosomal protein N' [Candidatus Poribacteria bacterium]
MNFVDVALPLPLSTLFTYRIPDELNNIPERGVRVLVPFRNKKLVGFVLHQKQSDAREKIKDIIAILDEKPVIDENLLKLAEWISSYYFCPIGLTLRFFIPQTKILKNNTILHVEATLDKESNSFEYIKTSFTHTDEQISCLEIIRKSGDKFGVFLLHGITGSGKTEIYLEIITDVLKTGKQAIIMVPEISLTPQTISRFTERFGENNIAVLHSKLGAKKRLEEWWRIKNKKVSLVIGARSAVFAPTPDLGITIIDEEHEWTYKQDESPRYHARDVAIMRAQACNAKVILGTATPSLESYYNAKIGKYKLISLDKRAKANELPVVEIINMRDEIEKGNLEPFSKKLINNIKDCLLRKEQVILFQNRRGFSSFVLCRKCGYTLKCKNCDVTLTYYQSTEKLCCHYCGYTEHISKVCPSCSSEYLRYFGIGTEQVEDLMKKAFPDAVIERLDLQTIIKKGQLEKVLDDFKNHKIDILIGTQIIAKGHDFPNVTLVGIIFADITLNLPDFRSAERTFQLLTQVAGRAGRDCKPGKVVIQTYEPEHYSIRLASLHDYKNFYEKEIKYRKALFYPPFTRIISILFKCKDYGKNMNAANK